MNVSQQEVTFKVPDGFVFTEDNLPTIAAMAVGVVGNKPIWVYEDGWHGTLTFSDKPMTEELGCDLLLEAWPSQQAASKKQKGR